MSKKEEILKRFDEKFPFDLIRKKSKKLALLEKKGLIEVGSLTLNKNIKSFIATEFEQAIRQAVGEMEFETYQKAHFEAGNYGIKTHRSRREMIRNRLRREILSNLGLSEPKEGKE